MFHALRTAIVAEVLQHIAEGDCPTKRSYNIETLENVIADLATPSPAQQSGELREALTALMYEWSPFLDPDAADPSSAAVRDYADAPQWWCEGISQRVDRILSLLASTTPPQSREDGDVRGKLELWFCRECNSGTRNHLFSIFGMPLDEIGESIEMQRKVFRHILSRIASTEAPVSSPVVGEK